MPSKFSYKRTVFVLAKVDELLAWGKSKERSATLSSQNSGAICARFGRDNTGGWRR
jgi:hypothetical protein